ncbi:ATP synthase F1 subcomplex delta subunit [Bacillus sp. OV322]|uniref:F0F1 ATP synthase subunit delta n=1 Tax=Bacillus sp. OV322 TaxID=1882764 RepID=UPI0008E239E5|nr:F0F1 ATP synthase subunit delta [Bacillus sp. OV322]SFC21823.1 ATP synthase F1 subcomplex delta subunit [Bacillus sp. OV322]
MSDISVAKPYAAALFQIAAEQNLLEKIEEDVRAVKDVFSNEGELLEFLEHPKVTKEAKRDLITASFAGLNTQVLNTLFIMIDRHRADSIAVMAEEFISRANEERSIADAEVYTVRPLTEEEKTEVSAVFAAKVGKKTLRIKNIADSSLLGGIKLRIGNRIFDGSVSGKLERLERQLLR